MQQKIFQIWILIASNNSTGPPAYLRVMGCFDYENIGQKYAVIFIICFGAFC